jgi:gamma-glutamylputrescine oxidase
MTRYDDPLWLRRAPRARRPTFPRLRGTLEADVVVVGAGLTGVLASLELVRRGARVVLLERGRVGEGATARAAGAIVPAPGIGFAALRARHGLRAARIVWEASRKSALELMAAVRRHRVRCDMVTGDAVQIATSAHQLVALEREYGALREAGFDVVAACEIIARSSDKDIIRLSNAENRVLLTEDKDLLFRI